MRRLYTFFAAFSQVVLKRAEGERFGTQLLEVSKIGGIIEPLRHLLIGLDGKDDRNGLAVLEDDFRFREN